MPFDVRLNIGATLTSRTVIRAAERSTLQFFDAVDPVFPEQRVRGAAGLPAIPASSALELSALMMLIGTLLGAGLKAMKPKRIKKFLRKKKNRAILSGTLVVLAGLLGGLMLLGIPGIAHADNDTVPSMRIYKGTLRTPSGSAVTTPVTLRFSYWNTSDYLTTDTTATGALNTGAASYLGWYEVHTVTPNANGAFSVVLGQTRQLVNLKTISAANLLQLHLQVEVKNSTAPETSYEVLDVNTSNTAVDRSQILAVPLARNADLLDQRDTGTGAYDIPVLNGLGKLPVSTVPLGTNHDSFMVDADASSTGSISLRFGTGLASQLQYDTVTSKFNFLSDVSIQGDLTVTGLINGVDLSAIASSTGALKASAGAGLSLKVAGGSYRLNGTVTNFAGNGGVAMPANSTVYVFFGSGGLTARTLGFPTDESYIPVAEVTTNGTAITGIDDRRVLSSDDRESDIELVYYPEFPNVSYQGDGADNVGQLVVGHDTINKHNFYQWMSTRSDLQDYDILLKTRLPEDFTRWQSGGFSNALAVQYRSTSSGTSLAKLDIQVYDTNGTPVTLSGSSTNLNSLTWQNTGLEFTGGTWTPGQDFLIRLRMHAKDSFQMHVGALRLRYVEFKQPE